MFQTAFQTHPENANRVQSLLVLEEGTAVQTARDERLMGTGARGLHILRTNIGQLKKKKKNLTCCGINLF